MKVLVTGAAGHLGRKVTSNLLGHGFFVRAADQRPGADLPFAVEQCDMRDESGVRRLLEGMDAVVHLANHTHAGAGPPAATLLAENVAMNSNVFSAAFELGVARVVFASSIQVMLTLKHPRSRTPPFSFPYLPLDSAYPAAPGINPYALSKLFAEQHLREAAAAQPPLSCTALRLPFLVTDPFRARHLASGCRARLPRRFVDWSEATAHLTLEDAAELTRIVIERQGPGYHQYFPAQPLDLAGIDFERTLDDHYPGVARRKPLSNMADLIDRSVVQEALGWEPRERIQAQLADD